MKQCTRGWQAWLVILFFTCSLLTVSVASVHAQPDRPSPSPADDQGKSTPKWSLPTEFMRIDDAGGAFAWPAVRPETRPGAYWWWPGSAVSKDDLTWNLETYRHAGWGNLGVIGIYGVHGEEARFLDVFSPPWFRMFNHTIREARRLGMNIDLTPSSGWRMGGPHVTPQYGEMTFSVADGKIVAKRLGAKVKRAGPGGQGLAINPYSPAAVKFHLDWLTRHFDAADGLAPRAFYYDSFENPGNWCPELPEAFQTRRGYSLTEHARQLGGQGQADDVRRVTYDYRRTLSDMLIDRVRQIVTWGNQRSSLLRMQAHGAPANLLDMYAAAAIPETEVFGASQFDIPGYRRDPQWCRPEQSCQLVNRFASSAAHVAGHNLVISESFTWLRNHYHTSLAHIKAESDNLFLNGINGIYYHGICYSPKRTEWPGWLFYAATQANARNSIFRDIPILNAYITRCQSILQAGRPDTDILLYWPIDDLWMGPGKRELRFAVHNPDWIEKTECGRAARWLIDHGYAFDFISDQQLQNVKTRAGRLVTEGGDEAGIVLLPAVKYMRVETLRHVVALLHSGATVCVWKHFPTDVPGWQQHQQRARHLADLVAELGAMKQQDESVDAGRCLQGDELDGLMRDAQIRREPLVDHGLKFIRRRHADYVGYFIANHSARSVDTWVPIAASCRGAVQLDPMSGRVGIAVCRGDAEHAEVYLQLQPGETRVLRVFPERRVDGPAFPVVRFTGHRVPVRGQWHVEFIDGGPHLPRDYTTSELHSWTRENDPESLRFAGAARYTIHLQKPDSATRWMLDLGDVHESARVWLNGKPVSAAVAHPFRVDLLDRLKPGDNTLAIEVTNLSANRIRDLDMRHVAWKKFYDINIVDQNYRPFDASKWHVEPSGLIGPVMLLPYELVRPNELPKSAENDNQHL